MTLPLGDDEALFLTVKFQTHSGRSGTTNLLHRMLDLTNIATTRPRFPRSFRKSVKPFIAIALSGININFR